MAIVINGSGTVTGLSVGGLPDGTVDTDTLANTTVTAAKVAADVATQAELDAKTDSTKLPLAGGTMTGNVSFGNNNEIRMGGDNDLKMYHDHANSQNVLLSTSIPTVFANNDTKFANGLNDTLLMVIKNDGKVGIGTSSPSSPLHVLAASAGQTVAKFESNQAGALAVEIDADADRDSFFRFQEAGTTRWDFFAQGSSGTNELNIRNQSGTNLIQFKQDGRGLSQFTAKFWCTWTQVNTHAIGDSHNISSLSDEGVGSTRVNFSNNMAQSQYVVNVTGRTGAFGFDSSRAAGNCVVGFRNASDNAEDSANAMCVGYGD